MAPGLSSSQNIHFLFGIKWYSYCRHGWLPSTVISDRPFNDVMETEVSETNLDQMALTAEIVSAYVSNNTLPASDLAGFIQEIHASVGLIMGSGLHVVAEPQKPAVSPKKSIFPDYIVCLEDGKRFKSLKRHLRTKYGLSPEQYRDKWSLPSDYPMVAPNYAKARSMLAKQMGLGQQRAKAA